MLRRSNGLRPAVTGARLRRNNSTLALGAAFTDTAVPLDVVDWRYGGAVDTATNAGSLTVVTPGMYRLYARLRFTAGTASVRGIGVRVNGTSRTGYFGWGANTRVTGSEELVLAAGDVVSLTAYTEANSANVFVDAAQDCALSLLYLGPTG
jgi:hypothetical protein